VSKTKTGSEYIAAIVDCLSALPYSTAEAISARKYGMSLWGHTAKITVRLNGKETKDYFLKVSR
jgi:hypothetical protein